MGVLMREDEDRKGSRQSLHRSKGCGPTGEAQHGSGVTLVPTALLRIIQGQAGFCRRGGALPGAACQCSTPAPRKAVTPGVTVSGAHFPQMADEKLLF